MAAKPIERFVKRQIQEQGGWPRILERIASGQNDTEIANSLPRPDGQPISRSFFNTKLHQNVPREQIEAARREGAASKLDHAELTARGCPTDRDSVQKARLVVDTDIRLAGLLDRERFGDSKQAVSITVNAATLHVDALRHRQVGMLAPQIGLDSSARVCETDTTSDSEVA